MWQESRATDPSLLELETQLDGCPQRHGLPVGRHRRPEPPAREGGRSGILEDAARLGSHDDDVPHLAALVHRELEAHPAFRTGANTLRIATKEKSHKLAFSLH